MWFFASIAVVFGIAIAIFNWTTIYTSTPEKNVSPVPLVGGLLIAVGFLGFNVTRPYWWIAVVIDFGTLGIIIALMFFLAEIWFSSRHRIKALPTGHDSESSEFNGSAATKLSDPVGDDDD